MRPIDADAYEFPGDLINEPTLDVQPVKHGHWIVISECPKKAECSSCGYPIEHELVCWWDYCPNCGTKMGIDDNEL